MLFREIFGTLPPPPTSVPCISILIEVFFYSPTDALVSCPKNNFKIYIKTAPTCLGVTDTPSSGSLLFVLAKVTFVIANKIHRCVVNSVMVWLHLLVGLHNHEKVHWFQHWLLYTAICSQCPHCMGYCLPKNPHAKSTGHNPSNMSMFMWLCCKCHLQFYVRIWPIRARSKREGGPKRMHTDIQNTNL